MGLSIPTEECRRPGCTRLRSIRRSRERGRGGSTRVDGRGPRVRASRRSSRHGVVVSFADGAHRGEQAGVAETFAGHPGRGRRPASPRTWEGSTLTRRRRMTEMPGALLMVVVDVDPEHEEEFNRWYDKEHIPERLAMPGFRSARRYASHDRP